MRDRNRLGAWAPSVRAAWDAFWPSRLVVFAVAVWVTMAGFIHRKVPQSPSLSHPFAGWPASNLLDHVFSPMAKWDSQHYLAIAYDGYVEAHAGLPPAVDRPAFFPLFPGIVRVVSGFAASRGLVLIMAYVVSLACFLGALALLHRLTAIELGERYARPTLLLLSFFPTALFFGIPYSESLFLLLAVGAFLAARQGEWEIAGLVLALASATRVPGLLLIVPVALIYLYGPRADRDPAPARGLRPRYPLRPEALWLLLAPLGLVAFSIYLNHALGDAMAWNHAQAVFGRETVDPLTGIWAPLREAGRAIGNYASGGAHGPNDYLNVMQPLFVIFALVGGVAALRRLPVAYGAWILVSLVPSFVSQAPEDPLWSSPRFIVVLFPLFMWLATVCERRRATTTVVAVFAAGMAVFTAQFALWSFVA
jgi:hypothetical protein